MRWTPPERLESGGPRASGGRGPAVTARRCGCCWRPAAVWCPHQVHQPAQGLDRQRPARAAGAGIARPGVVPAHGSTWPGTCSDWSESADRSGWPKEDDVDHALGYQAESWGQTVNAMPWVEIVRQRQRPKALWEVIPNDPDYRRYIPIEYRLNAKGIVGDLAQDLQNGRSAHIWVDLAHMGLTAAEIAGLLEGTAALIGGLAVAGPFLAAAATFLALGAPYQEAAANIAKDWAATGYSRGVVMGANQRSPSLVREYYGNLYFPEEPAVPSRNHDREDESSGRPGRRLSARPRAQGEPARDLLARSRSPNGRSVLSRPTVAMAFEGLARLVHHERCCLSARPPDRLTPRDAEPQAAERFAFWCPGQDSNLSPAFGRSQSQEARRVSSHGGWPGSCSLWGGRQQGGLCVSAMAGRGAGGWSSSRGRSARSWSTRA